MDFSLIAIIVAILWIGSLGLYLYTSRQQSNLQDGLEQLQKLLDAQDEPE